MAAPRRNVCYIGVRGSAGISMNDPRRGYGPIQEFPRNEGGQCRVMSFSQDGSYFAFCDGIRVRVVNCLTNEIVHDLDKPRTSAIQFSPLSNVIATWEPYFVSKEQAAGTPNLHLWDMKTGASLKDLIQKKSQGWCPQWSADEVISARNVNNEVHFFENNSYDTIHTKLHLQRVASFCVPPKAQAPYHVAVYVPGSKGSPSYVRVYRYPNFSGTGAAVANKSFYKADKVELIWNDKGNGLLVLTVTDSSAESYYGEQGLHFISLNGESCLVPRPKNGPVYNVVWNPDSSNFCVVYGFMPAKATLYNMKAEPIFDFGTGPRNECFFNPHGNMLVLAGFGNLRGNVEFWDLKRQCLISNPGLPDTTLFEWCSDGQHILTATTAPRLRVGNGFKVLHYLGEIKHEYKCAQNEEIWEAKWQPAPEGLFKAPQISGASIQGTKGVAPAQARAEEASKTAYVPPALRGESGATLTTSRPKYREEYEPPSNLKQAQQQPENLSKSALKNKKKREAKQRAKQEEAQGGASRPQSAAAPAQAAAVAPPPSRNAPPASGGGGGGGLTGDPETDKRIRALKKKLQQVQKIKERQASGQPLELNQVDKLKQEDQIIEELESLTL